MRWDARCLLPGKDVIPNLFAGNPARRAHSFLFVLPAMLMPAPRICGAEVTFISANDNPHPGVECRHLPPITAAQQRAAVSDDEKDSGGQYY